MARPKPKPRPKPPTPDEWTASAFNRLMHAVELLNGRIERSSQWPDVQRAGRTLALSMDGHSVDVQYAAVLAMALFCAENMCMSPDPERPGPDDA